jgi:hypothetical protein
VEDLEDLDLKGLFSSHEELDSREFARLIRLIEISQKEGTLGEVPESLDPDVVVLPVSQAHIERSMLKYLANGCLTIIGFQGDYPETDGSTYRGNWRKMLADLRNGNGAYKGKF